MVSFRPISKDFSDPDLPTLVKQNTHHEDIFVFRFDHQTYKIFDETEKWREELKKFNVLAQ